MKMTDIEEASTTMTRVLKMPVFDGSTRMGLIKARIIVDDVLAFRKSAPDVKALTPGHLQTFLGNLLDEE